MLVGRTRRFSLILTLLMAGCFYPVQEKIDYHVCELAAQPRDLQPLAPPDSPPEKAAPSPGQKHPSEREEGEVQQTSAQERGPAREGDPLPPPRRLTIPPELLPRGPVPPIVLPPPTPENEGKRREAIQRLYPPLPVMGPGPQPVPGPQGSPLTLSELQRLALSNSPQVRQAAANVESARGAAIQAGLPPNPTLGYEGDTAGTTGGAGYQGGYLDQIIKTAGKLQLARAVATMDLRNAELALKRAEFDLLGRVRGGYFAVLVAQESMRVNQALVRFSDEVYRIEVELVRKGGFAAPYEPMYLRVFAVQARAGLVQARNRYISAWKQLAAALGLPGMPPTQLAGRVDISIPIYNHQLVLNRVLQSHTDVLTADTSLRQAQLNLRVAQVTPIPDVEVRMMLQKDYTGPPFLLTHSLQVGMPIPVWNRNQGGIRQAEADLVQASEGPHRVRATLTATLAEAFERYENNRVVLDWYRNQILPDQVRVYRGVYERYQREPAGPGGSPPGFNDVVVAQQTLAGAVVTYLTTLGAMWQAVVDVADVMQTSDLFQINGEQVPTQCISALPELDTLLTLPCQHPCSPLPNGHQEPGGGAWPQAVSGSTAPAPSSGDSAPSSPAESRGPVPGVPPSVLRISNRPQQLPPPDPEPQSGDTGPELEEAPARLAPQEGDPGPG